MNDIFIERIIKLNKIISTLNSEEIEIINYIKDAIATKSMCEIHDLVFNDKSPSNMMNNYLRNNYRFANSVLIYYWHKRLFKNL